MNIICDLKNINELNKLNDANSIIIYTKFSMFYENVLNNNEIENAIEWCVINNKKAIINIDCIISENKMEELYKFLDKFYSYDVSFMFSDMSVLLYFEKKNMTSKLIYNAPTYVCNYDECLFYKEKNIRVMLSNELSIDDVIKCMNLDNVIVQTYGFFPIYYSLRKVISLYKQYMNLENNDNIENNFEYKIIEETRKESNNIIEYNDHVIITNSKRILFYNELEKIVNKNIYLNGFKLNDKYYYIIKYFKEYLESNYKINNYNKILEIDKDVDSSLLYSTPSIL